MPALAISQISAKSRVAFLSCALLAGCTAALQPILLGSLVRAGALAPAQLGHAAAAEAMGTLVATTLAATFLSTRGLRLWASLALATGILCNILTPMLAGAAIVTARFVDGCSSGLLIWLLVAMLTREDTPALTLGIYNTLRTVLALALALIFANIRARWWPHLSGYHVIAALEACMSLSIVMLPAQLDSYTAERSTRTPISRIPDIPGLFGLAASLLFMAGIMGFWIYAEKVQTGQGSSAENAMRILPVSLLGQVVGGSMSALLARYVGTYQAIFFGIAAICLAVMTIVLFHHPLAHFWAFLEFGFFWIFVPTFQIPLLLDLDPSARAAMLNPSAQLSGSALGPIMAALLVAYRQAWLIPLLTIGLLMLAALSISAGHWLARRRRAPRTP